MSRVIETGQDSLDGEKKQAEDVYRVNVHKLKNMFEETDQRGRGRQPNKPPPMQERKSLNRSALPIGTDRRNNENTTRTEPDDHTSSEGTDAVKRFQLAKSLFTQYDSNSAAGKFSADRKRSASPARPLGENMEFQTAPTTAKLQSSLMRPAVASKPVVPNSQLRKINSSNTTSMPANNKASESTQKNDAPRQAITNGLPIIGNVNKPTVPESNSIGDKQEHNEFIISSAPNTNASIVSKDAKMHDPESIDVTSNVAVVTITGTASPKQTDNGVSAVKEVIAQPVKTDVTPVASNAVDTVAEVQLQDQRNNKVNVRGRLASSESDDSEKHDDYVLLERNTVNGDLRQPEAAVAEPLRQVLRCFMNVIKL